MNEKEIEAAAMSFDEFRDEPHAIAMALLDARAEREKADKALTHALRSVVAARDDFDALLDEVESERIRAFDLSDDLREATAERDALRKDAEAKPPLLTPAHSAVIAAADELIEIGTGDFNANVKLAGAVIALRAQEGGVSYVDAAINRLKDDAERMAATPPTREVGPWSYKRIPEKHGYLLDANGVIPHDVLKTISECEYQHEAAMNVIAALLASHTTLTTALAAAERDVAALAVQP